MDTTGDIVTVKRLVTVLAGARMERTGGTGLVRIIAVEVIVAEGVEVGALRLEFGILCGWGRGEAGEGVGEGVSGEVDAGVGELIEQGFGIRGVTRGWGGFR
ncbi:hypothetical protein [Brevibacterium sanguinis]|uniref:hypothetical protein n=1 Tax=Brevibacterium sanguinis TaxID=232444 RepID=UPI0031D09E6C